MRWLVCLFVLAVSAPAFADPDPHAEMAAALAAQVDTHPAPAALPVGTAALRTAAVPAKSNSLGRAATALGQRAANQASDKASMQAHAQQAAPASLVGQAQAASAAVAGQTQAAAAKDRATHPHPSSPRR